MLLMVVLDLSAVFLVGSVDGVAAQMFPDKQIHADPEDCPNIAELLPLKQKEQTIKTETRKQNDQNKTVSKESATMIKSAKVSPSMIIGGVSNHSQLSSRTSGGSVVS